ncbi:putative MFS peptide transporter Ptr2 [Patellaria atrata CBS 101060]|uniref:MFS peptide transporter Ptr2 n=1 Tax=Patellaria atrata CBS 101060 TaxID=1346257 RepID=A0A9P4S2T8_9PEZI|nr:putative MFS peptide transporter Ptr2 [Patellaria atrata CBS 101060]
MATGDHTVDTAVLHHVLPHPEDKHKEKDIFGGELRDRSNSVVEKPGVNEKEHGSSGHYDSDRDSFQTKDGDYPTEAEKKTLRHVGESLPWSAFLVAFVEFCERFTYYGVSGLFQNYIQRPFDGSLGRGALGMGHQGATGLSTFFQFWCYVTPIFGAIIADQYLGKYKTIVIFCGVYIVGLLILTITSIPSLLERGSGTGGFIASILIIGIGTGGIKSNVAPLIADQYKRRQMAISTLESGERIILDPAITIQRIYMIFYFCINVGSLSLLATPYMERDVGFWSAYLLGLCMFLCGFVVLVFGRKYYVVRPPQGSVITDAFRIIWQMIKRRDMNAAKPSYQREHGLPVTERWNDHFVDEVKRALIACKVFTLYPIFWVVYGQFSGNFVSQAAQMRGHGLPNDLMQNFDPISIIVFIPIIDRVLYPVLRKLHIPFPPINRITLGFCIASLSMAYAAIVQHLVYKAGPCYGTPFCPASVDENGVAQGNNVHIAVQTPAYVFIGIAEIFASVTGLEYAYTKAPPSMKSFVQSMYLLTNAFGSAISEAFNPVLYDPAIMWMYTGLAVGSFGFGCFVWIFFHKYNYTEDEMNRLEQDLDKEDEEVKRRGSNMG